jgi:hypothetical protein
MATARMLWINQDPGAESATSYYNAQEAHRKAGIIPTFAHVLSPRTLMVLHIFLTEKKSE